MGRSPRLLFEGATYHAFSRGNRRERIFCSEETPGGNLSEFMQRVLTRFARYFNRAHRLVGHVFQGRYGAKLVDQESHFKEIVRYVELNPYRLKKGKLAEFGVEGKARAASRWRRALVYIARRFYRMALVDIAGVLGRSESTVSLMWGRHRNEIESGSETQQLLRSLDQTSCPKSD